jgi:hypothetical protein
MQMSGEAPQSPQVGRRRGKFAGFQDPRGDRKASIPPPPPPPGTGAPQGKVSKVLARLLSGSTPPTRHGVRNNLKISVLGGPLWDPHETDLPLARRSDPSSPIPGQNLTLTEGPDELRNVGSQFKHQGN